MSFVECCKHKRKAISYNISPEDGYISCIMHVINELCPICDGYAVELERINAQGITTRIRRKNSAAYEIFDRLENSIISKANKSNIVGGRFFLPYSEYGKKKKCYSNLSTLKMGTTDVSNGSKEYQEQQHKHEKFIDLSKYYSKVG